MEEEVEEVEKNARESLQEGAVLCSMRIFAL